MTVYVFLMTTSIELIGHNKMIKAIDLLRNENGITTGVMLFDTDTYESKVVDIKELMCAILDRKISVHDMYIDIEKNRIDIKSKVGKNRVELESRMKENNITECKKENNKLRWENKKLRWENTRLKEDIAKLSRRCNTLESSNEAKNDEYEEMLKLKKCNEKRIKRMETYIKNIEAELVEVKKKSRNRILALKAVLQVINMDELDKATVNRINKAIDDTEH